MTLVSEEVARLAAAFRRRREALARTLGQSEARWQVLDAASGVARTVPQIARHLGLTRQSVQPIADALVESGLARFVRNPHHKRSALLQLTDSGRAAAGELQRAFASWESEILQYLEPEDVETFLVVLRALRDEVDNRPL